MRISSNSYKQINIHAGHRGDVSWAVNILYWKHHPRCPVWGPALWPRLRYVPRCQTQSHWARPSFIQDPSGPLPTITPWQRSRPRRPRSSVSNLQALLWSRPVSLHHSQWRGRVKELIFNLVLHSKDVSTLQFGQDFFLKVQFRGLRNETVNC